MGLFNHCENVALANDNVFGAVACSVVGLGSNFADELCAHVFSSLFQLDLLGDGNTVVGDQRSAVLLVEDDVAALRTDGDFNGVSELVDTAEQSISGFNALYDFLCHDLYSPD